MTLESDCPVILLASGQTLRMRRVKLYEEEKVNEISVMRAQAARSLGGISTGIGFWGSPEWALGGAAALGIVEGLLSSAARKQGLELFRDAERKFQALANGAMFFDACKLVNSHVPHPQAWCAAPNTKSQIDITRLRQWQRDDLFQKYNKTTQDVIEHASAHGRVEYLQVLVKQRYIHNGDEFVDAETDIGIISIRWSHVVTYFPAQSPSGDHNLVGSPAPIIEKQPSDSKPFSKPFNF